MFQLRHHPVLRPLALVAALGLASACRDKSPASADSSLAQDLAMAQKGHRELLRVMAAAGYTVVA